MAPVVCASSLMSEVKSESGINKGVHMRYLNIKKSWLVVALMAAPLLVKAEGVPPAGRVSIEKAREAATKKFQGKIQGEELEFEGGRWIYSFDMKSTKDKRVHEVHVDAISGKVLGVHTETAADEKKEIQEDAQKKQTH